MRALATWRGETPRIAMRNDHAHPLWQTYRTHPPIRYAPSPLAELDHWVDRIPGQLGPHGNVGTGPRARRQAARPHIIEFDHWFRLAGVHPWRWGEARANVRRADELLRRDECRAALTVSRGILEHCREFLAPDVWPKLHCAYGAFPTQPDVARAKDEPFTILSIGNRLSDKGIPEVLAAFEILRARYGERVRMVLVSNLEKASALVPEGVEVVNPAAGSRPRLRDGRVGRLRRMGPALKARVYRCADVLALPVYIDTSTCFPEACAFGVPTISTYLHGAEDFVRDGESGYVIDTPVAAYTEEYGRRWRTWGDFLVHLERMRESGQMIGVVQELVDRLELMVSGGVDMDELRKGARRLHAERFSPETRNAKLKELYADALGD